MATDLKRLKQHFKAYEPTLKELERKYQVSTPARAEVDVSAKSLPAAGEQGVQCKQFAGSAMPLAMNVNKRFRNLILLRVVCTSFVLCSTLGLPLPEESVGPSLPYAHYFSAASDEGKDADETGA